jgi:hypothetical protein
MLALDEEGKGAAAQAALFASHPQQSFNLQATLPARRCPF